MSRKKKKEKIKKKEVKTKDIRSFFVPVVINEETRQTKEKNLPEILLIDD